MYHFYTQSEAETIALAKKFARRLKGGDVVLLQGELGSGKTTFVKGLAAAFGIRKHITSPTFVLLHIHPIRHHILRLPRKAIQILSARASQICTPTHLVHVDAYRVKSARELKDVGLADWLGRPDTITVVEWGEKIKPLLKGKKHFVIKFQHGKNMAERIVVTPPNCELRNYPMLSLRAPQGVAISNNS